MRRVSSGPADLKQVQIAGRALVYGFARMNIDGHFPRWGVGGAEAEQTAEAILDLFIEGIARRSRQAVPDPGLGVGFALPDCTHCRVRRNGKFIACS